MIIFPSSSKASVMIASHGGRFLVRVRPISENSRVVVPPKNEFPGKTYIVRTHPRYPRHFRPTEKKKDCRVVASTLSLKRILTSAVSFSLFLSTIAFAIRVLKRSSKLLISDMTYRSFTFFASMIFLENILDLMKLSSHNRI